MNLQNKEYGIITQEPELKQHELSISEGSRGYKLYNYTETELDRYKEENK